MATQNNDVLEPGENRERLGGLSASDIAPRSDPPVGWADPSSQSYCDMLSLWDGWDVVVTDVDGQPVHGHVVLGAAVDRLLEIAAEEPAVTSQLSDSLPPGADLCGLDCRVKSPLSTAGKVLRDGLRGQSPSHVVHGFSDTLRYTVRVRDHDDIVPAINDVLGPLVEQGMTVVRAKDMYYEGAPYKGLHFQVAAPDGTVFEVQLQSQLSQAVKDTTHVDYERFRDISASEEVKAQAKDACQKAYEAVPTPKGLSEVREVFGCPVTREAHTGRVEAPAEAGASRSGAGQDPLRVLGPPPTGRSASTRGAIAQGGSSWRPPTPRPQASGRSR